MHTPWIQTQNEVLRVKYHIHCLIGNGTQGFIEHQRDCPPLTFTGYRHSLLDDRFSSDRSLRHSIQNRFPGFTSQFAEGGHALQVISNKPMKQFYNALKFKWMVVESWNHMMNYFIKQNIPVSPTNHHVFSYQTFLFMVGEMVLFEVGSRVWRNGIFLMTPFPNGNFCLLLISSVVKMKISFPETDPRLPEHNVRTEKQNKIYAVSGTTN